MKVDVIASERHFWDHLRPVWEALPAAIRGDIVGQSTRRDRLTMVASVSDLRATRGPVIYLEHGAGYIYTTAHPSYAGGPERERVVLFACTNQRVADANMAAYPDTPTVIVGCPKLDQLLPIPRPNTRTVVFAFHWNCGVVPETTSALPYMQNRLRSLAHHPARGWAMLGHGHPRSWPRTVAWWGRLGVPTVRDFTDAVTQGDVLVGDTTSVLYEWAALGRPVVVVNSPEYRRDVHHGLRFWEDIPGPQVDDPDQLDATIHGILDHDTWAPERARITSAVYPYLGQSTPRTVDAIMQVAA